MSTRQKFSIVLKSKIISHLFCLFRGLVLKAGIFGKTAISEQLVEEDDEGGSNSSAEVLSSCFALLNSYYINAHSYTKMSYFFKVLSVR